MKRDMDLIRKLLLRIEAEHLRAGSALFLSVREPPLRLPGDDPDNVDYAMRLIADAGFLDLTKTQGADSYGLRGISWRGHEFLDSVRDPEIWRQTKEGASKAGAFTIELLTDLAKGFVKTQIKKATGVDL
jgi:hypothetical protein